MLVNLNVGSNSLLKEINVRASIKKYGIQYNYMHVVFFGCIEECCHQEGTDLTALSLHLRTHVQLTQC